MRDSIFREIENCIEHEAEREVDTLEKSVDESTENGDVILEEGREVIERKINRLRECNNTLKQGQSINDEINPGTAEFSEFIEEHGFGVIDEDGDLQQEGDG